MGGVLVTFVGRVSVLVVSLLVWAGKLAQSGTRFVRSQLGHTGSQTKTLHLITYIVILDNGILQRRCLRNGFERPPKQTINHKVTKVTHLLS